MKHGRKVPKLQRDASHRKALLANLVCALVEHRRIRTTLAKAKAVRPLAEKMVTLGKRGDLHARRTAVAELRHKDVVKKLFFFHRFQARFEGDGSPLALAARSCFPRSQLCRLEDGQYDWGLKQAAFVLSDHITSHLDGVEV